jgi:general secretion pathway protein M
MFRSPSPLEQRALALLLLGLFVGSVYWGLLHSWFVGPMLAINERMRELTEQSQHFSELLGRRDVLQQQLQDARTQSSDTLGLLPGEDGSAVAADLMQRVTEQVKSVEALNGGCSVVQRMPIATERSATGPYRHVMLSMDLDCAIEPLVKVLYSLEYGRPLLFVEELNISRSSRETAAHVQASEPTKLTVHLLIAGYMGRSQADSSSEEQGSPTIPSSDAASQTLPDDGVDQ